MADGLSPYVFKRRVVRSKSKSGEEEEGDSVAEEEDSSKVDPAYKIVGDLVAFTTPAKFVSIGVMRRIVEEHRDKMDEEKAVTAPSSPPSSEEEKKEDDKKKEEEDEPKKDEEEEEPKKKDADELDSFNCALQRDMIDIAMKYI